MEYTAESEAPEIYHRWTALATIAGALRRRVWFEMGYFTLYPNNYVVLTGPPGAKKTTAMNVGRRFLAASKATKFVVDSTSREQLIYDMSKIDMEGTAAMTAYSGEFGTLLTTSEMNMVLFLIEMYDAGEDYEHRTRGGGPHKIVKPALNIVGCTTPDWLSAGMPLQTAGIGLLSRMIFAYADGPQGSQPFPELTPRQVELAAHIIDDLSEMAKLSGCMTLAPDAKAFYKDWYDNKRQTVAAADPRLTGYYSRKPIHVLKTAMAFAVARGEDLVITMESLTDSFAALDLVESRLPFAFEATGKNPLRLDYHHVQLAIENNPKGLSRPELMRLFKHTVRQEELIEVLNTLHDIGAIKRVYGPRGSETYLPAGRS